MMDLLVQEKQIYSHLEELLSITNKTEQNSTLIFFKHLTNNTIEETNQKSTASNKHKCTGILLERH